ncbi:MAG: zinc-dependent metalloprotease [Microcoleaceae cyanobacterium]
MKRIRAFLILSLTTALLVLGIGHWVQAQSSTPNPSLTHELVVSSSEDATQEQLPFDEAIKGTQKRQGLFTLYFSQETGRLLLELRPDQLNRNFLCFTTLGSGLGEAGIVQGGWLFDDLLFQWQRVQDKLQLVIPNINFRTDADDPQARSIQRSFSDSVLFSVPILSVHPERQSLLIDFGALLKGERDLAGLTADVAGFFDSAYGIDDEKSYLSTVDAFPLNVEIEAVYGFSRNQGNGESVPFSVLPDDRAFNLKVRYSFLEVPTNSSYQPRLADERVGYFTTVYKDVSQRKNSASFVRYINRWDLEKQDPTAALSPAVKPIVFWIENTVPLEYRQAIREGILMWNPAFETAGFIDAIQVQQMPDDADWDPADVRYNTVRWSNSFDPNFSGIGPSHVNPLTGEILDADIVLEGNALSALSEGLGALIEAQQQSERQARIWQQFSQSSVEEDLTAQSLDPCDPNLTLPASQARSRRFAMGEYCFKLGSQGQLAIGALDLTLDQQASPKSPAMKQYLYQYLRQLTAHEIGHVLGLRHNFHGSTLLSPEKLNVPTITQSQGLVSSVMDYAPVNLAPRGQAQGDYYSVRVGPYDYWAIEYGYKSLTTNTPYGESRALEQIAQRSAEPELAFATDEDLYGIYLDPAVNSFDLSDDMLQYAEWQLDNVVDFWQQLERFGQGGTQQPDQVRKIFNTIWGYSFQQTHSIVLHIGGQSFDRSRAGGQLPLEVIPVEQQRRALKLLQKYVFAEDAFQFSPTLLNQLAPARWQDWGNSERDEPLDYPINNRILRRQSWVLRSLLSPTRLSRLHNLELKARPEQVLGLPELFETLQNGIWTEILQQSGSISTIRRSLQREHLEILSNIVRQPIPDLPADAQTLAWYELKQLQKAVEVYLDKNKSADAYTVAHVEVIRDRLNKVLEAQLLSN